MMQSSKRLRSVDGRMKCVPAIATFGIERRNRASQILDLRSALDIARIHVLWPKCGLPATSGVGENFPLARDRFPAVPIAPR
jgi:hypothetical protein